MTCLKIPPTSGIFMAMAGVFLLHEYFSEDFTKIFEQRKVIVKRGLKGFNLTYLSENVELTKRKNDDNITSTIFQVHVRRIAIFHFEGYKR